jgi:uncharacterized coiled-coil protein SlyX
MAKSPEEKLLKRHADLVDEIHTAEVNHENAVHDQRIADLELDRAVRAGDSEKIRNQQAVLAAAMMVHDKVHDRLTELAQQLDALEDEMIAAGVRPPRMKNINEALTELLGALGVKDAHRVVRTVDSVFDLFLSGLFAPVHATGGPESDAGEGDDPAPADATVGSADAEDAASGQQAADQA